MSTTTNIAVIPYSGDDDKFLGHIPGAVRRFGEGTVAPLKAGVKFSIGSLTAIEGLVYAEVRVTRLYFKHYGKYGYIPLRGSELSALVDDPTTPPPYLCPALGLGELGKNFPLAESLLCPVTNNPTTIYPKEFGEKITLIVGPSEGTIKIGCRNFPVGNSEALEFLGADVYIAYTTEE